MRFHLFAEKRSHRASDRKVGFTRSSRTDAKVNVVMVNCRHVTALILASRSHGETFGADETGRLNTGIRRLRVVEHFQVGFL
jgi:hypothetical protein